MELRRDERRLLHRLYRGRALPGHRELFAVVHLRHPGQFLWPTFLPRSPEDGLLIEHPVARSHFQAVQAAFLAGVAILGRPHARGLAPSAVSLIQPEKELIKAICAGSSGGAGLI